MGSNFIIIELSLDGDMVPEGMTCYFFNNGSANLRAVATFASRVKRIPVMSRRRFQTVFAEPGSKMTMR